jgi:hypothetical protein
LKFDSIDLQIQSTSDTKRVFSLGLSKHLALTALFMMSEKNWTESQAVARAWELYGELSEVNARTLKKCVSEAQALVSYVCQSQGWSAKVWRGLKTADARLAHLETILRETPLKDALLARQTALGGSKGGRPKRSGQTLDAVVDLIRRANGGEHRAEDELAAVRAALAPN